MFGQSLFRVNIVILFACLLASEKKQQTREATVKTMFSSRWEVGVCVCVTCVYLMMTTQLPPTIVSHQHVLKRTRAD